MFCFPQLNSGAIVQVPFRRTRKYRVCETQTTAGATSTWADTAAAVSGWDLRLTGLTGDEATALVQLFQLCEGRRKTFCFLDPTANLLAWSEELTRPVWSADPMLSLQGGVIDPLGGQRATKLSNGGQARQALTQPVSAPAHLGYCLSAYVRSEQKSTVALGQISAGATKLVEFGTGPVWKRIETISNLDVDSETWSFFIEAVPGSSLEVFGLQVEAQPGASAYKRSGARTGVYSNARFAEDELQVEAKGPGVFDCTVRIQCNSN